MYYIYILTNKNNRVLYTGSTNDLARRLWEHRNHFVKGFTDKYNVTKLVYYEYSYDMDVARAREKQIKGWTRKKRIDLIESMNPEWEDLGKVLKLIDQNE